MMKRIALTFLTLVSATCPAWGYATGDGAGGHLAHQWITQEAWRLFRSQFGPTELDAFVGDVREYPDGLNDRFIEGAYDEDVPGENPWGEGATTLEWTLSSPPPFHQFEELPRIR